MSEASRARLWVVTVRGDEPKLVIRARQEGLSAVLYKPFKVDELLDTIRKVFVQG